MEKSYARLKSACYATNLSMSVVGNLSPLLFLTFRALYGISYTRLGLLVLINFSTQLVMDLLLSFYSHKVSIPRLVKLTPVLTASGLLIYALSPVLFPGAVYAGLVLGTLLFAASGGLSEVLISPVIAAIPSQNPEREMSKLHSVYAWGVVGVVIISTLFLQALGQESWQYLALLWLVLPILAVILYIKTDLPALQVGERPTNTWQLLREKGCMLCIACIFLGGASECVMAQWSSSYLEQALGIPKVWGDVFGVAMFSVMLGLGRTLYAKRGKHIGRVLIASAVSASLCYLAAAFFSIPWVGLAACAVTGLCTAMLWPGNLIVASARYPAGGVVLFALMAAGGDLGASVGPQLVGIVTDAVLGSGSAAAWASHLGIPLERLSIQCGMALACIFPIALSVLSVVSLRMDRRTESKEDVRS